MEKLRNYIWHPKMSKLATYLVGAIDGMCILEATNYLIGNSAPNDFIFTVGATILAHCVGREEGKRNESKIVELCSE